jgi:NAD(P)H-nitrite reductase large subunit
MDREEIICHCMEITRGEIIDAIKNNHLTTVEEVGDATEAGTVCGSCQDDIEEILKTLNT